ncbi:MAG: hypothetical protein GQF41_2470 [Candidatus Rifleibacterium amylolyticum]|nr:MAG: hypothetical protein GQF41_2470 [Candidatus Rifleibacterium amylolyticum]
MRIIDTDSEPDSDGEVICHKPAQHQARFSSSFLMAAVSPDF